MPAIPPRRPPHRLRVLVALCALGLLGLPGGSGPVPSIGPAPLHAQVADAEAAAAQERADWIRANYTKREVRIPMRDGVRLWTAIYTPNRPAGTKPGPWPVLLHRTPYDVAPYGADAYPERLGPSEAFARDGFIFVYQDVRGKYMSEGEFVDMRPHGGRISESTDTWDTIDWLVENLPDHNGKVGMWGISYPGFYASAGMIDSHPALAAVSPQAPIADWFWDDMHRHGAFNVQLAFSFFSSFGRPRPEPTTESPERFDLGTPDGYDFFLEMTDDGTLASADDRLVGVDIPFWNDTVAHPNYDEFWQSRNILPHLENVGAAVMVVGGWFDTEDLYGPLNTYRAVEEQNPDTFNMLVMGPWPHGGWGRGDGRSLGEADFGFATSPWFQDNVELPFFLHFLKDGPRPDLPEALTFETGANRWRRFDAWPPEERTERRLYLHAGGGLSFEPPTAASTGPDGPDGPGYDTYVSDPAKPVPYTTEISPRWTREYMVEDQRFAARRPDVLVYESEPLEHDLTLAGPILADLRVSTSGEDSDWVVKVIDVYPDRLADHDERETDRPEAPDLGGTQRLVRAEVMRGRFRESYEVPKPFVPGEVTPVRFELHDLLHTFKKGHKLMVQIQSTWFPFVDRNPGTWVDNIFDATPDQFVPVENRVHGSAEHPSSLVIGVLPDGASD